MNGSNGPWNGTRPGSATRKRSGSGPTSRSTVTRRRCPNAPPSHAPVSGVTGFIGAALASRLIEEGLQVFGLARAGSRQVHRIESLTGLTVVEVADFSGEELRRSLANVRADVVFNLAAAGVQPGDAIPTTSGRQCRALAEPAGLHQGFGALAGSSTPAAVWNTVWWHLVCGCRSRRRLNPARCMARPSWLAGSAADCGGASGCAVPDPASVRLLWPR